jgi:hypothetical protein
VRTVVAALASSVALVLASGSVSAETPHPQPRASKNWQKIVTFKGAKGQVCRNSSHYQGHKVFQILVRIDGRKAHATVTAKSHIESNGYPASDSWHPTVHPGQVSKTDTWAGVSDVTQTTLVRIDLRTKSGAHKTSQWDRWIDVDHC